MFVAMTRLPDRDGYFLRTATRCEEHVFFASDPVPALEREALLAWISQAIERQRETVAAEVHKYLKQQIDYDQAVAQRSGDE
jgi:hypothetical protein